MSGETTTLMYGLTRCDTCKKARKWLDANKIDYRFIDYRDSPVPSETLLQWSQQVGGWGKLVNRASTTWRQLSDEQRQTTEDDAWLGLLADYPTLVKRPVLVTADGQASVGFKEALWAERFNVA